MSSTSRRLLPRIVAGTGGSALVAVGLAGLFLPVLPGIVLLAAGLGVLGREFDWARRILDRVRSTRTSGPAGAARRSNVGEDQAGG